MNKALLTFVVLTIILLSGCNFQQKSEAVSDSHTSRISLDWAGTYEGLLPCADCEGILTVITLNDDNSFTKKEAYLKNEEKSEFTTNGNFEWDSDGSVITLKAEDGESKYFVAEGRIIMLDKKGKKIKGKLADLYILNKKETEDMDLSWSAEEIEDKTWILTRLLEKEIEGDKDTHYLIFISEDNRLSSKAGCNIIFTSYEILKGRKLRFNEFASTKMFCPDTIEDEYIGQLINVNNYTLSADGKILILRHDENPIIEYKLAE